MKNVIRIVANIICILLGGTLFVLGITEVMDEFWGGMGSALIAVGVIRTVQFIRLRKDQKYREKMEIEATDERHRFIRNKAWAWAGYLFIMIMAVVCIVLRIMGQEILSMAASGAVSLMLVLFWVCYFFLKRKY
jgi:hypothetical protein